MSDGNSSTTENSVSVITSGLAGLPEPLQNAVGEAFKHLLVELVGVPAAYFRRWSASINDVTEARSRTMQDLREAAVSVAKDDPLLQRATLDTVTPAAIRKIGNRLKVAQIAADEIKDADQDATKAAPPDHDWMNKFMRYSEDASSERLQGLFGKILAGEIVNPGAFSPATLRAVSELTQQTAKDFEGLWSKNFDPHVYRGSEYDLGEKWELLNRLDEAGLVHSASAATFQPKWSPTNGYHAWTFGGQTHGIAVLMAADVRAKIPIIKFTRTGVELGKILPRPDHIANLRALADDIPKRGVGKILLYVDGRFLETLWSE